MLEEIVKKTNPFDAIIILIAAFAIVSFWRGIWGLMDIYLFPGNETLSLIISVFIGLLILFLVSIYRGKKEENKKVNKKIKIKAGKNETQH